jgi:hypothetical protein
MNRKTVVRIVIIAVAVIALMAVIHVSVNYGPAIVQAIRKMHGM